MVTTWSWSAEWNQRLIETQSLLHMHEQCCALQFTFNYSHTMHHYLPSWFLFFWRTHFYWETFVHYRSFKRKHKVCHLKEVQLLFSKAIFSFIFHWARILIYTSMSVNRVKKADGQSWKNINLFNKPFCKPLLMSYFV